MAVINTTKDYSLLSKIYDFEIVKAEDNKGIVKLLHIKSRHIKSYQ